MITTLMAAYVMAKPPELTEEQQQKIVERAVTEAIKARQPPAPPNRKERQAGKARKAPRK